MAAHYHIFDCLNIFSMFYFVPSQSAPTKNLAALFESALDMVNYCYHYYHLIGPEQVYTHLPNAQQKSRDA